MKIKWLGHACFLITSEKGITIITDPYKPATDLKYDAITEAADVVTVSHEHGDHSHVAAVRGDPQVVRGTGAAAGIEFRGVATFHDDAGGRRRGANTIFCFAVDGIKVCHAGDLGHVLSEEQAGEIGEVDVLLLPVGGFFTIDAGAAGRVCDRINPKIVVPMHYKNEKCSFPIEGVAGFLKQGRPVTRKDDSEIDITVVDLPSTTTVMVLQPAK